MTCRRALATAVALALWAAPARSEQDWPFQPVPIGAGPGYHPPARWPLAGGASFGGLQTELNSERRVHLELFANRRVVIVPGGIGVSGGRTELYGHVLGALWRERAWTLAPGGVIELARDGLTLGDFFAVWGQPLGADRLLGFGGRVLTYVNGERRLGSPAGLELHAGDQIVVAINGYVVPHRSFVFPRPRR
jgi:hypothetical protein